VGGREGIDQKALAIVAIARADDGLRLADHRGSTSLK
jgi:hypothetical protein